MTKRLVLLIVLIAVLLTPIHAFGQSDTLLLEITEIYGLRSLSKEPSSLKYEIEFNDFENTLAYAKILELEFITRIPGVISLTYDPKTRTSLYTFNHQFNAVSIYPYKERYVVETGLHHLNFNRNNTNKEHVYPNEVIPYLEPSEGIESDHPLISQKAEAIAKNTNEPYQITKMFYHYVMQNSYFVVDDHFAYSNKGALWLLENQVGVCEDYSKLLVALLRAEGIPARTISGYAFNKSIFLEKDVVENPVGHMWAEAYLPPHGWVLLDPTITTDETKIMAVNGLDPVEVFKPVTDDVDSGFGNTGDWIYIPRRIGEHNSGIKNITSEGIQPRRIWTYNTKVTLLDAEDIESVHSNEIEQITKFAEIPPPVFKNVFVEQRH